jgi:hypothetical protein
LVDPATPPLLKAHLRQMCHAVRPRDVLADPVRRQIALERVRHAHATSPLSRSDVSK